jgi:hypothetical protein
MGNACLRQANRTEDQGQHMTIRYIHGELINGTWRAPSQTAGATCDACHQKQNASHNTSTCTSEVPCRHFADCRIEANER